MSELTYQRFVSMVVWAVNTLRIGDENNFTIDRIARQLKWTYGARRGSDWINRDWIVKALEEDIMGVVFRKRKCDAEKKCFVRKGKKAESRYGVVIW